MQLNIYKFFNQLSDKNQQLATKIENMFIQNTTYIKVDISELPLLTLATLLNQKFYVYGSATNKIFIISFLPINEDIRKLYDVHPITIVPETTILYGPEVFTLTNIVCCEIEKGHNCENKQLIFDYKTLYMDKIFEKVGKT